MHELRDEDRDIYLAVFEQVAVDYPGVLDFDAQPLLLTPDPWVWDWKPPLRVALEQLAGRPDVTAWTAEQGLMLRSVLSRPAEEHPTLLGLMDDETCVMPAVDDAMSVPAGVDAADPA